MQYIDIVDGYEGFELKIPRWGFARAKRGFDAQRLAKKKDLLRQVVFLGWG